MSQKYRACQKYGSALLVPQISDNNTTDEQKIYIGVDCYPLEEDYVRTAIKRFKNTNAEDAYELQEELFMTGGYELIRCMHKIGIDKCMPGD